MEWFHNALEWLGEYPQVGHWTMFFVYMLAGWFVARIVTKVFNPIITSGKLPVQVVKLLRTTVITIVWVLAIMQALQAVGVNIVSILGAAGVVGMAIGFASQTALSNVISGVFLVTEKSVKLGDFIRVGGNEGVVESINLLSVWLRQGDNSLVRVPNESLIKSPVVNVTGAELRRCDFAIGVDYGSNLKKVRQVIAEVVSDQALLADTPEPVILFKGFGESSLDLHVGAWCKTADYAKARYEFAIDLLAAFKEEGISIPFPTRSLFMNEAKKHAA